MTPPRLLAAVLLAGSLDFSPVLARVWNISEDGTGDAPTIQAGIDSAEVGDEVLVGPGTYREHLDFLGKDITVRSEGGPEVTVIDASLTPGRGVVFLNGEGRGAVLEGFTVTGAHPSNDGGGIFIYGSAPTIRGNVIRDNEAVYIAGPRETGWGGGILSGSVPGGPRPLIEGNQILDNRAGSNGGGIAVDGGGIEIVDNLIEGNHLLYGDGGGIWIRSRDAVVIRGNTIRGNVAGDHGGGIYAVLNGRTPPYLSVEASYNLIEGNRAMAEALTGDSGGGIWMTFTVGWIHHNTIVKNEGDGPDATWGGGIALYEAGTDLIEENIIAFSVNGGGIRCGEGTTPTIRNNLAWANVGGEGVGACPDWWQGDGNEVADPIFCGADAGDYTLSTHSPALSHPAGPLGAFPIPACDDVVRSQPTTWGAIKARYR